MGVKLTPIPQIPDREPTDHETLLLLYVEISKRRINITVNRLSSNDVTTAEILEAGEDLGTELGRALEAKISVRRIIARLQE